MIKLRSMTVKIHYFVKYFYEEVIGISIDDKRIAGEKLKYTIPYNLKLHIKNTKTYIEPDKYMF